MRQISTIRHRAQRARQAACHRAHTPIYTYDTATRLYRADCACQVWADQHPDLDKLRAIHNHHRAVEQKAAAQQHATETRAATARAHISEWEDAIHRLHPIRTRGGIIRWVA